MWGLALEPGAGPQSGLRAQMKHWKAILPIGVAVVLGLIPAPDGLPPHAWWYFAIFAGVIAGLVLEPLP
ncbi:MAG: anion permease, partial [Burkholderiaceae bacterium]